MLNYVIFVVKIKRGKSRLQSLYIKQPGNFDKNTNDHYNEEATQSFMQSSGQNQYITLRSWSKYYTEEHILLNFACI